MKKSRIYCPYCAKPIVHRKIEGKVRDFCMYCSNVFYDNPLPVASSILMNENREIVLVKRKNEPYKDMWCLPIGFAESGEEIKEAALRELKEEAGIDGEIIKLIDVDTVENYFYGSIAIITYEVKKTGGIETAGDDAVEAKYFPIYQIPELAWSSNEKAIDMFIDLYKDIWSMIDSVNSLFPNNDPLNWTGSDTEEHKNFLRHILIQIIENLYN